MPDYERHARQIALDEVGPAGQQRLADTPVHLAGFSRLAAELHTRAGGALSDDASVRVECPVDDPGEDAPAMLGLAAWGAVEAARRVLGAEPRALPDGLLARLRAR